MATSETTAVRDLAMHHPGAARVFEELRLDYCCGGGRTLEEACARAGLSVEEVMARLSSAPREATTDVWETRPMGALIDHIVTTHHEHDRKELDRLRALSTKVAGAHGGRHPELVEVRRLVLELANDLEPHMLKEEQVLFPYVRKVESAANANTAVERPFFGTVLNPIRMMMTEHETVGGCLRELRAATRDFAVPDDGCTSYRTLYQALQEFEQELHVHIHLENDLLFPRALRTEQSLPRGER